MGRSATGRAASLRSWRHAVQSMPRIAVSALCYGLAPAGLSTARTLCREGIAEIHWKALGDGLVRFLRHAGPVFTKFGQILATRRDLLPPAVCSRLESLYSEQPPMRRRQLKRALRRAYGPEHPFQEFDATPLAVGSVGQVHRARLASGDAVIVKLIRPNMARKIERDLEVARVLIDLCFAAPGVRRRPGRALLARSLEDLARGYIEELDLEHEAAALRSFARRFANNSNVCTPHCFDEFSSEHVLVMEELVGEPLSAYRRRAEQDPQAAQRIANLALSEILAQIFEDGRFHADPHAGNLLILEDGRLGIIDLGLTGELTRDDRRRIVRAVRAFLARDAEGLMRTLLEFGTTPPDFDVASFSEDVKGAVESNGGAVLSQLRGQNENGAADEENSLEGLVTALFTVASDHGVYVPPQTTLLIKTLVTVEGVARSLHPELDLASVAIPVLLRAATPRWMRWAFGRGAGPGS